ncbi:MAG: sigma-70 family RNA polymerase sigma factor [Clostridiales bacterium]|jgi:RNA polymerase sporulation-specific sigma factor|nr:sigma-70 family RNA polymerase sigma factor [Clostridiales bacterium]
MSEHEREQLIVSNIGLVGYIAKRFRNIGYEYDDLVSIGCIGLIKAVNTYDATKGVRQSTFYGKCITNELLMACRKSKRCGQEVVSLDTPIGEQDNFTLADVIADERDYYAEIENKDLCESLADGLKGKQKQIIYRRFLHGELQTQTVVAKELGYSRSSVSRLESNALIKMRKKVRGKNNE